MHVQIEQLQATDLNDFRSLIEVFERVFEMENFSIPHGEHLGELLRNQDFFALVAKKDGIVVGGLTVYVLHQYYSEKPLAYIYDLAVEEELQRRGIGKQLIAHTLEYCKHMGFEEVFVQADKVDDYALDFYRKTGITEEEDVSHFYYTLS